MKKHLLQLVIAGCVLIMCSTAHAAVMVPYDSYWSLDDSGEATFSLLVEDAGYASTNTFGIYQLVASSHPLIYEIFTGSDTPGTTETLTMAFLESLGFSSTGVFGFYLDSSAEGGGGIFLSDSGAGHDNNGMEYMLTGFDGTDYTLYWEDLANPAASREPDYNDMVVKVTGMSPTPIPGALFLLAGGLPFVLFGRGKRS